MLYVKLWYLKFSGSGINCGRVTIYLGGYFWGVKKIKNNCRYRSKVVDVHQLIKCHSFGKFFENGRKIWEDFYNSFRTDLSQPYKLKFGSFIPPKSIRDNSYFNYSIPGPDHYSIEIEYVEDIEERKRQTANQIKVVAASILTDTKLDIQSNQKLKIDTKNAQYIEIETTSDDGEDIQEGVFFAILDDLKPGLEITVSSSNPKLFELYRGEMEELFKSLKFDENP